MDGTNARFQQGDASSGVAAEAPATARPGRIAPRPYAVIDPLTAQIVGEQQTTTTRDDRGFHG